MAKIETKDIKKLLGNDPTTILEIGSNVGRDSQRFLDSFPKTKLFCFEPDPRCIRKFKKRINDSRCELIERAVADTIGCVEFHLSGGSKPNHKSVHINSSSLLRPKNHLKKFPWCKFDETILIKSITLDSWYADSGIQDIDFIWADVQGAEEKMILGGSKALSNTRYFYTEFSDNQLYEGQINLSEITKLLPNFEIQKMYGTNVLLRNCD